MRLDKFLAECGFGTRSEVKKLIKSGLVVVAGKENPKPESVVDPEADKVFVGGKEARYRKFVYLMLNKPSGYVSATWDKRLPVVTDLLPEEYRHFDVFPVGRLDIDTEGLLLLTNDGDLSHRLLSPKKHVPKTYIAKTEKLSTELDVEAFLSGMDLGDFVAKPGVLKILSETEPYFAEVTISEGKFHQVKRMFEKRGNKVLYLKRIKMKDLCLDESLCLGEIRELTEAEIEGLLD